jgi:thioredoxin 1
MTVKEISKFTELTFDGIVVLDIYAPWCNPCKLISSFFETLAKQYESSKIHFYKYNCSENQELASLLEVTTIPTFIVFEKGEIKERLSGANKEHLKAMLERCL